MYAGIDFDTKAVHVVFLSEDGEANYLPFVMHGMDAFERTRAVRDAMPARGWWKDIGVIAVGLEEPMRHRGGGQQLKAVQGAILACLPPDLLVNPMNPQHWRKTVGLSGNASKEAVSDFANWKRLPPGFGTVVQIDWPQDACDAYCLALAVQTLCEPAPNLTVSS